MCFAGTGTGLLVQFGQLVQFGEAKYATNALLRYAMKCYPILWLGMVTALLVFGRKLACACVFSPLCVLAFGTKVACACVKEADRVGADRAA